MALKFGYMAQRLQFIYSDIPAAHSLLLLDNWPAKHCRTVQNSPQEAQWIGVVWAEFASTFIILTTTSKKNLLKGPGDNTIKHMHTTLCGYTGQ